MGEVGHKKPPVATRFKKGTSGNPGGKPSLHNELKKVKEITNSELKRTISKHLRMSKLENEEFLRNEKEDMLGLILAAGLQKSLEDRDLKNLEILFMRSLGRVVEAVEVANPVPVVIQRRDGSEVELTTKVATIVDTEEEEKKE